MIITVAVPRTHIVHTASLRLFDRQLASHGSSLAVAGRPFPTELRIRHTRRWGTPDSLAAAARLSDPADTVEFVYSIEANPDVWLVAGQRRGHFHAAEHETRTFPILLLPLRPGLALLPQRRHQASYLAREQRNPGRGGARLRGGLPELQRDGHGRARCPGEHGGDL